MSLRGGNADGAISNFSLNLLRPWSLRIPYQIFDHTADIGLILHGKTLEDLFESAGLGLFSLITDVEALRHTLPAKPGESVVRESVSLGAENVQELLFAWLREMLFRFSANGLIFLRYHFLKISETGLKAELDGIYFGIRKHDQRHEVKAVTRHQFAVKKNRSGWHARVILDI